MILSIGDHTMWCMMIHMMCRMGLKVGDPFSLGQRCWSSMLSATVLQGQVDESLTCFFISFYRYY